MKVSVFGLGYVGSVSAASFAADGHTVVGVDVNPTKVQSLNEGRSPIVENDADTQTRRCVYRTGSCYEANESLPHRSLTSPLNCANIKKSYEH